MTTTPQSHERMIHQLKILPQFFELWASGKKRAELRKNDRDFRVGDIVILNEWDPKKNKGKGAYTRRAVQTEVRSMDRLADIPGTHKADKDFVVLSLVPRKIYRLPQKS